MFGPRTVVQQLMRPKIFGMECWSADSVKPSGCSIEILVKGLFFQKFVSSLKPWFFSASLALLKKNIGDPGVFIFSINTNVGKSSQISQLN